MIVGTKETGISDTMTILITSNSHASEIYSLQRLSECLFYNRPGQEFDPRRHIKFKFKPKSDIVYEIPVAVKSIELIDDQCYDVRLEGIADRYDDNGYTCHSWYADDCSEIVHDIAPGIGPDSRLRILYNTTNGISLIEPI